MDDRPYWFRLQLWIEVILISPFLLFSIFAFFRGNGFSTSHLLGYREIRAVMQFFGPFMVANGISMYGEYWLNPSITATQKIGLTAFYFPRVFAPLAISVIPSN